MDKNKLVLNFDKGYWFQGFRENEEFIKRYNILHALSDKNWEDSKYINKKYNVSSPTKKILGRYFVNILSAMLLDYSKGNILEITLKLNSSYKMDVYSKEIIDLINKYTDIHIDKIIRDDFNKAILTRNIMNCATKRGLYDCYKLSNNKSLNNIYKYFQSIFFNKKISVNFLKESFINSESDYYKWIFTKAIINKSIRLGDYNTAKQYVDILKSYKRDDFDYWNSKSFMILVFKSQKAAITYLDKRININSFLDSKKINYSESLVMKNYASMLPSSNKNKKKIMQKCLIQTPQDVDLWKLWYSEYPNNQEMMQKYFEIFESGYSDIDILKNIKITDNMDINIVRAVLLCSSDINRSISLKLIEKIKNKKLQKILLSILNNENDLYSYVNAEV